MDFAYRCYRCGKVVYRFQILFGGHRCKKCGSRKVEPITQDLTKFGIWYCKKVNSIGTWIHEKIKSEDFRSGIKNI